MSIELELAHIPNYIREAAAALHRYCHSGEVLAKEELHRLMAALHDLIEHLPGHHSPEAVPVEAAPEPVVTEAVFVPGPIIGTVAGEQTQPLTDPVITQALTIDTPVTEAPPAEPIA
jgi:hypothetical protein